MTTICRHCGEVGIDKLGHKDWDCVNYLRQRLHDAQAHVASRRLGVSLGQPVPKPGDIDVVDYVVVDVKARAETGAMKYGTKLQPFNGRDAVLDAYQEAIDLVMYLRQMMLEKELTALRGEGK